MEQVQQQVNYEGRGLRLPRISYLSVCIRHLHGVCKRFHLAGRGQTQQSRLEARAMRADNIRTSPLLLLCRLHLLQCGLSALLLGSQKLSRFHRARRMSVSLVALVRRSCLSRLPWGTPRLESIRAFAESTQGRSLKLPFHETLHISDWERCQSMVVLSLRLRGLRIRMAQGAATLLPLR